MFLLNSRLLLNKVQSNSSSRTPCRLFSPFSISSSVMYWKPEKRLQLCAVFEERRIKIRIRQLATEKQRFKSLCIARRPKSIDSSQTSCQRCTTYRFGCIGSTSRMISTYSQWGKCFQFERKILHAPYLLRYFITSKCI